MEASYSHERALIGLCLNSRIDLIEAISLGVTAKDFEDELCREIFLNAHGLLLDDQVVDLQSVAVKMPSRGFEVAQLATTDGFTVGSVKLYAETILDRSRDKEVLSFLNDVQRTIMRKPVDHPYAAPEVTDKAIDQMFTQIANKLTNTKTKTTPEVLNVIEQRWEHEHVNQNECHFIPTGFTKLDNALNGGIPKGAMMTIGASTGRGKSLYSINIASRAALKGFKVLYVTLEMNAEEIVERIIADHGNVKYAKVLGNGRGETEYDAFNKVRKMFHQVNFEVCDNCDGDIGRVERIIRFAHEIKPYDLVIIDYIQQYQVRPNKYQHEKMRELSQFIKLKIAKKYNVAVIAPAQMNRMAECEGIDGLRTGNIADAASIERDSDIVAFIAHENPKKPSPECISYKVNPENFCWIKIGKQRKGSSNLAIPMRFNPEFARFEEI